MPARLSRSPLHPLQFEELGAVLFYKASLLNRVPKVGINECDGSVHVAVFPLRGLSTTPVFSPWVDADYAKVLAMFTAVPISELFDPQQGVRTTLQKPENEEVLFMDIAKLPWRGCSQ